MKIVMRVYKDAKTQVPLGVSFSKTKTWRYIDNHIVATFGELCGDFEFSIPASGRALPAYKKFGKRLKLKIHEN